MFNQVN